MIRNRVMTLCLVVFLSTVCAYIYGQETKSGLDSPLKLDGAPMTLPEFCAALTRQSGFAVKYPDYIVRRRIQVACEQPVRRVLDAVCELNGWTWSVSNDKAVKIDGPVPALLKGETAYMGLKRIMPPDLAMYLHMPDQREFNPDPPSPGMYQKQQADVRPRCIAALNPLRDRLKKGVAISEMKPGDVELIMLAVLLSQPAVKAGGELLTNDCWQAARPESMRVRLSQGSLLLFECDLPGRGNSGFGTTIMPTP